MAPLWTNSVDMATIYTVNFMGKMKKNVSPYPISTIFITESQNLYVCVGLHLLSSKMLLYLIFYYYGCRGNCLITLALHNYRSLVKTWTKIHCIPLQNYCIPLQYYCVALQYYSMPSQNYCVPSQYYCIPSILLLHSLTNLLHSHAILLQGAPLQ